MTRQSGFKQRVRARMSATGECYDERLETVSKA